MVSNKIKQGDCSTEEEDDDYQQAVIDFDFDELQEIRNDLKEYGRTYWSKLVAYIERRLQTAQQRIQEK